MTGSLQVKYDKYYIVLNTIVKGKRKQKWISTGLKTRGNKREAEKLLRETINKYEKMDETNVCDILFVDCILTWLDYKRNLVDTVTYQGYELLALKRVIPYFDKTGIKLVNVNKKVLQDYFDSVINNGRLDGKGPLSASSIKRIKNIVNQTLNYAVKNDMIASNPCNNVELPKPSHIEAKYYNSEQLKALFDAIEGDILESLIKITALYGLRRSEVLGIKWDSIDFELNRLTIKHTVSKVTEVVEKDKTKTSSSHRSFSLTSEAAEIFRKAKQEEEENRKLFGKDYHKCDYVFKWPNGVPFSPDYVTSHFSDLLDKHDLPHIRFHELRHSCASLLLANGYTLKDVQEYMGHADIQITADIYGHLDTARKNALSDGIARSIFRC